MPFSGPWRPLRRLSASTMGEKVVLVPAGPYSASPQETMLEKVAALDLVLDGSNWAF